MPTLERQEVSAPSWETCLRLPFTGLKSLLPPHRGGFRLPPRYFQTACSSQKMNAGEVDLSWEGRDVEARGKDRSDSQKRPWEGLLLLWQPELSTGHQVREAVAGRQTVCPLQPVPSSPRNRRRSRAHPMDVDHDRRGGTYEHPHVTHCSDEKTTRETKAVADGVAHAFRQRRDQARSY